MPASQASLSDKNSIGEHALNKNDDDDFPGANIAKAISGLPDPVANAIRKSSGIEQLENSLCLSKNRLEVALRG